MRGLLLCRLRAAQGRIATALAVAIEIILEVERRDTQATGHGRWLQRTQVTAHLQRGGELQTVAAVIALVDDALHVAQLRAGTQHHAFSQVRHATRLTLAAAIVQAQAAPGVVGDHGGLLRAAGSGHFAGLPQAATERGGQLAETLQTILPGQGQRCGDAHLHAFQCFPVGRHVIDHGHCRRGARCSRSHLVGLQRGQRLPPLAGGLFLHRAADAQPLADLHRLAFRQPHEQRIRRCRIAITGILHVNPTQTVPHVGGDHGLDRHRLAFVRAALTAALHLADGQQGCRGGCQGRAGACSSQCQGE
ncbi:hypothetical protein D3C81_907320 [compost metagenome]